MGRSQMAQGGTDRPLRGVRGVVVPTKLVMVLTLPLCRLGCRIPFPALAEPEWHDGGSGRAAEHEDPQFL